MIHIKRYFEIDIKFNYVYTREHKVNMVKKLNIYQKYSQKRKVVNLIGICFVIQPFDESTFENRYEDSLVPAIEAAGLIPYRVDRDPSVVIPVLEIEAAIKKAEVVLADISLDNPNVWYELGIADTCQKPIVLICSNARKSRFPCDIQHRAIIKYKTGSKRDFHVLEVQITEKIRSMIYSKVT